MHQGHSHGPPGHSHGSSGHTHHAGCSHGHQHNEVDLE
mgnify:FL=1|jgi:hypothetical protein